jgi:hypothetical protein
VKYSKASHLDWVRSRQRFDFHFKEKFMNLDSS